MLAYDYPILGFFWSTVIFFMWIAWFMLLFRVIIDVLRSKDLGGVAKAAWLLFALFLPFLGVLVYVVARGDKMAQHQQADLAAQEAALATYVRGVAAPSAADELAKLAELKSQGVITDNEFEAQKSRLLA